MATKSSTEQSSAIHIRPMAVIPASGESRQRLGPLKGIRSDSLIYIRSLPVGHSVYAELTVHCYSIRLTMALKGVAVIMVALAAAVARPTDDKSGGCSYKQDSFSKCFIEAGNHIFKTLPKGDKKMGLPVLEPLKVKKITILDNGENMHLVLMDSEHRGLSTLVIHDVQADPEHYKFTVNMTTPQYNIKGKYDLNAKLAMMPLMGKGEANITFEDVTMVWEMKGKPVSKKGKQYMDLTEMKVTFSPTNLKINLDDMFNGNEELGQTMNKFLNDNWEEVMKNLKPRIERSFSQLFKTVSSQLLEKVPYKDMFPDV